MERPGLSKVRDLGASGGISVVVAQNRDRIARDPIITGWPQKRISAHLDAAIAAESERCLDEDVVSWLRIVEDCDKKRAAYQDQQAAGLMTMDELGAMLTELNKRKATVQRELDRVNEGRRRADQNIIRLTREVEDWATDVSKYRISSNRPDKVVSVVAGEEVNR